MAIELLNVDCMDFMRDLPDKAFELAIVDPPYGIGADSKNSVLKLQTKNSASLSKDYGSQNWDNEIPDDNYFIELKRVSKHQIIWGANYFNLQGGFIYWDKCVTMPTYSDGELAYCSLINSVRCFKYAWHGMIQHDMKNKEGRIHPTQKPVALYKWLLKNYAKPGDRILDTHGGSMSIAIACHQMGFDLTLCEIDKDYYEAGLKRYVEAIKQQSLFSYQ